MSGIWAKSILASKHAITGARLDTILVRFPRIILAEVNTHRALSKNTASSRAIPIAKMIEQVQNDPFVPEVWTRNQSGMQGVEETRQGEIFEYRNIWRDASKGAVLDAKKLARREAHKQIVNRLLEPFMWTIALWSGTEWDNFFALRDHPAAEPHIQILARAVRQARDEARVQTLQPGEWHLPFVGKNPPSAPALRDIMSGEDQRRLSVACCASTSYKTVDGFNMTLERAQKVFDSLSGPPLHASPFEHVAQADEWLANGEFEDHYETPKDHRNFKGFRQYRAIVEAQ